jgi:hypothetical protein
MSLNFDNQANFSLSQSPRSTGLPRGLWLPLPQKKRSIFFDSIVMHTMQRSMRVQTWGMKVSKKHLRW